MPVSSRLPSFVLNSRQEMSWLKYICKLCGKEFESNTKTAVCTECRTAVCVVCGKEFELKWPYTAKTCSSKCSGIYRKESGIAKESRAKAEETFKERYDSKGELRSNLKSKICAYCGKEFIPNSSRQKYCKGPHYGKCPICGKQVEIKDMYIGPTACSKECRQEEIRRTSLERYGADNIFKSDIGKQKIKNTMQERYGVDHYSKTAEYQHKYRFTMQERYGVNYPMQSKELLQKAKLTNQLVRGVDWPTQSEDIKNKIKTTVEANGGFTFQREDKINQIRKINLERYGTIYPTQNIDIQNKIKQTMIDKYGDVSPLSRNSILKSKIEETNLNKYGSKSPMGSKDIRNKSINTWQQKYGVDNPFKSEKIKSKIKETLMLNYGVDNPMKSDEIKKKAELTNIEKYGSSFYGSSKDRLLKTMQDPSKLSEFILFRNNPELWIKDHYNTKISLHVLSQDLGVDIATISKHVLNSGCEYLIEYRKSTMEVDLMEFIKSIVSGIQIRHNDRSVIYPQEIDIYLPEYNIGIECNPTYTHNSSKSSYNSNLILPWTYHKDKSIAAMKNGIFLFHIFGYQWTNRPEVIKSMLKHLLGKDDNVYFARNTIVKEVSDADSKRFLDANHLQGYTTSKVRLGIYQNDELISLMTFSKQRGGLGFMNDDAWELTRFCTKLNSRCVGGASKLFKQFIKKINPIKVISFSSIDSTKGNVYQQLGFRPISNVNPGYVWVNLKTDYWYTRVACQKSNLRKLFHDDSIDIDNLTEAQIMESRGFVKVYNSGLIKWQYVT